LEQPVTGTVDLSTRGGRLRAMLGVTPGAENEAAHALACTTAQLRARLAGDDPDVDASDIVALSDVLAVPIPWIQGEQANPLQVLLRLRRDVLTPTQELAMEVLAARNRLGEQFWTFESKLRGTLRTLEDGGLVVVISGDTAGRIEARLSAAGRLLYTPPTYTSPADHLREKLQQERAGTEQLWAMIRAEQQTNRGLRALLEQYESGDRPPLAEAQSEENRT
jgi:hypothetical protein